MKRTTKIYLSAIFGWVCRILFFAVCAIALTTVSYVSFWMLFCFGVSELMNIANSSLPVSRDNVAVPLLAILGAIPSALFILLVFSGPAYLLFIVAFDPSLQTERVRADLAKERMRRERRELGYEE